MTDIVRNIFGYSFHYVATGRLKAIYIRRGDKLLYTIRRWNWQRARWDFDSADKPREYAAGGPVPTVAPDVLKLAMLAADQAEGA